MKRLLMILCALAMGWAASELLYRWPPTNERIEQILNRDDDHRMARNLRKLSRDEVVKPEEIEREANLLRAQFGDDAVFAKALQASGLKEEQLRLELAEHLHERAWLEKQMSVSVTDAEARAGYAARPEAFAQAQRFRVRHIFLAAPESSSPEVIAAKQSAIQGLAVRLLAGDKFEALTAEASEDEATKLRGGDLGYFSATRMPPEFMAELDKLAAGEVSAPIRSHLGFHIVQVTEIKPAGIIGYDAAAVEVKLSLGNQKRKATVSRLREQLAR